MAGSAAVQGTSRGRTGGTTPPPARCVGTPWTSATPPAQRRVCRSLGRGAVRRKRAASAVLACGAAGGYEAPAGACALYLPRCLCCQPAICESAARCLPHAMRSLPFTIAARWRRKAPVGEDGVLHRKALCACEVHLYDERPDVAHAHHGAAHGRKAACQVAREWGEGHAQARTCVRQWCARAGAAGCYPCYVLAQGCRPVQGAFHACHMHTQTAAHTSSPTDRLALQLAHVQRALRIVVQPHRHVARALCCSGQLRGALLVRDKQRLPGGRQRSAGGQSLGRPGCAAWAEQLYPATRPGKQQPAPTALLDHCGSLPTPDLHSVACWHGTRPCAPRAPRRRCTRAHRAARVRAPLPGRRCRLPGPPGTGSPGAAHTPGRERTGGALQPRGVRMRGALVCMGRERE